MTDTTTELASIPVLQLSQDAIYYPTPIEVDVENVVEVFNLHARPVLVKLRTTAPKLFAVMPAKALLAPKNTSHFRFLLLASLYNKGNVTRGRFQLDARFLTEAEQKQHRKKIHKASVKDGLISMSQSILHALSSSTEVGSENHSHIQIPCHFDATALPENLIIHERRRDDDDEEEEEAIHTTMGNTRMDDDGVENTMQQQQGVNKGVDGSKHSTVPLLPSSRPTTATNMTVQPPFVPSPSIQPDPTCSIHQRLRSIPIDDFNGNGTNGTMQSQSAFQLTPRRRQQLQSNIVPATPLSTGISSHHSRQPSSFIRRRTRHQSRGSFPQETTSSHHRGISFSVTRSHPLESKMLKMTSTSVSPTVAYVVLALCFLLGLIMAAY